MWIRKTSTSGTIKYKKKTPKIGWRESQSGLWIRKTSTSMTVKSQVYDFAELERVDRRNLDEDIIADVVPTSHDDGRWDVDTLISSDGAS